MPSVSVAAALAGRVPLDEVATIKGWVRTRRDSKAGFSFLAVSDGSCFDNIQIVAPNALPNYPSEVLQITTGCAVACTGKLVRSQGKGQAIEMQAERVEVLGWVEHPDSYPDLPETAHVRIPEGSSASSATHEHLRRSDASASRARHGDPPVLS